MDTTSAKKLIIVGGGPSGLACAIYAASEGFDVTVIEAHHFGGQCRMSTDIENLFGHPHITGRALTARAIKQARQFGAKLMRNRVVNIDAANKQVYLACGTVMTYDALILALGLNAKVVSFEHETHKLQHCIKYNPDVMREHKLCFNQDIVIVGGANSAAQAALYIQNYAASVKLVIRGDDLSKSMSTYLVNRINASNRITVCYNAEVSAVDGTDELEHITLRERDTNQVSKVACQKLFMFIGFEPHTDWLRSSGVVIQDGYISTDNTYHTGVDGIFAIGDVQYGSVKRIGNAIGAAACVVAQVHQYIAGK